MIHVPSPLLRRFAPLALALGCALAAPAMAQDDAARQKQLEQARADLQQAARRVAELSGASGIDETRIQSLRIAAEPGGKPGKPRLGVLLGVDEQAGVRVVGITPDGGADRAGLKAGDRLLRIKGKAIAGGSSEQRVEDAREALDGLEKGKPVRITYQRDGRQHEIDVTPGTTQPLVFARTISRDGSSGTATVFDSQELAPLTELGPQLRGEVLRLAKPSGCTGNDCAAPLLADIMRWNGLNLVSLNPQLGRYFGTEQGALVLSQGALPGLEAGDVIQQVEGKPVKNPVDAMTAMSAKRPGEQAKVTVMRDRVPRQVQVTVPERMQLIDFIPAPPAPPAPPRPPAPATPAAAPQAPAAPATAAFL